MALFGFSDISFNKGSGSSERKGPLAPLVQNEFQTTLLRYPLDVGNADKGHYMVFYIREQRNTGFKSGRLMQDNFKFDDGSSANYSKQRILWDFGDGTTSESVTATHYYNLPGWYTVKCYTLGSNGRGNESSFSQNILVKDYISDTIVLSGSKNKTETGSLQNPFTVFRFNSWQNFYILSGEYTINLHVSGNVAPLLNAEKYNSDKWGHLKPYARFETFISNPITGNIEKVPVNNLQTDKDTNKELYVKLDYDKTLIFCDKSESLQAMLRMRMTPAGSGS
jgi:hypothetical protein